MTPDFELCRVVGESADRLISAQVFMSGGGADMTTRNITKELYEAARERQGEPLTYLAAKALIERVKPRDVVLICSGFFDPPSMITEGDGPIGAVALGRALALALDATPVFLTEVTNMPKLHELVQATGLEVVDVELARTTPFKASILPLPIDRKWAVEVAKATLERTRAAGLICIEKPSPSAQGTYHIGAGIDVSAVVGKVEHVLEEAKKRGVLSIGIGDGGNEAGMGLIVDVVREVVPTGNTIATTACTDILVVATIANWGAYAIEACLAAAMHLPEAIHSLSVERRIMEAGARAGLIDPMSGLAHGWVDGTPPICSESILELLRAMVELRLDRKLRPYGAAGNGRRWHQNPDCVNNVKIWADHLAAQEQAYFSK